MSKDPQNHLSPINQHHILPKPVVLGLMQNMIRSAVDLSMLVESKVSDSMVTRIIQSAPHDWDECGSLEWQESSECWRLLSEGDKTNFHSWALQRFKEVVNFWLVTFPDLERPIQDQMLQQYEEYRLNTPDYHDQMMLFKSFKDLSDDYSNYSFYSKSNKLVSLVADNDDESDPIPRTSPRKHTRTDDELAADVQMRIKFYLNEVATGERELNDDLKDWIKRMNDFLFGGNYSIVPVDFD